MSKKNLLHNAWSVTTVVLARLRFVAVFVVAALVVGYWDNITNHVDKWTRPPIAPDALAHDHASDVEFYCPMHPDVVRGAAGNCPKCGMPLVKRKRGQEQELPADVLARVQLTPQRVALANIGTTPVAYRPLVRAVRALGVVDYDETKLARISARVPGRVERLYVTYTGQAVKAGEPLFAIYSPEVYAALREYLSARTGATTRAAGDDARSLAEASRRRLLLWGVTERQLDALAAEFDQTGKVPTDLPISSPIGGVVVTKDVFEGAYVQTGDNVYTVADLSRLWLQVKLYERDVPLVDVGTRAEVTVDALPGERFAGAVMFKSVAVDPASRTLDARVEVDNRQGKLRPGMYATARLRIPIKPAANATTTAAFRVSPEQASAAVVAAMEPYRKASDLLAADKTDGVADLVKQTIDAVHPLASVTPELAAQVDRMSAAVIKPDAPIREVRSAFREVSAALIEIARSVGLPERVPPVQVVRCSMSKGSWIEPRSGQAQRNPYMGTKMPTCGDLQPDLPAFDADLFRAPQDPAAAAPAGLVLAVPTSAVIDTGPSKIVYVESSRGVFDMRAITVGPEAEDHYPVLSGLDEGEKVVTVGTFLVDAENRLNPQNAKRATPNEHESTPMKPNASPHSHS